MISFSTGHIPLYVRSSYPFCILWNYADVLKIFHQHHCVVMYAAGHDHDGGYAIDDHGIHHLTLRAIVEAHATEDATVTAHVFKGRLEVHNLGPRRNPIDKIIIKLNGSNGK